MLLKFLNGAVTRHLEETQPLIGQLNEVDIMSTPFKGGREIGEVVLHLLRSLEFYMRGIVEDMWKPLPYSIEKYNTSESIIQLCNEVFDRVKQYLTFIHAETLNRKVDSFNRPATVAELILEMLEHSIHHRGQITVYYRLLGIVPKSISYIV